FGCHGLVGRRELRHLRLHPVGLHRDERHDQNRERGIKAAHVSLPALDCRAFGRVELVEVERGSHRSLLVGAGGRSKVRGPYSDATGTVVMHFTGQWSKFQQPWCPKNKAQVRSPRLRASDGHAQKTPREKKGRGRPSLPFGRPSPCRGPKNGPLLQSGG